MRKALSLLVVVALIAVLSHVALAGTMLVSDSGVNKIFKYNASTGASEGLFADVSADGYTSPGKMEVSPFDNKLYVIVDQGVIRYNTATGALEGLVHDRVTPNGSSFVTEGGIAIAPADGRVFVGGNYYWTDGGAVLHPCPVYAIDPVSGLMTQFYQAPDSDGLVRGLAIGPGGDVYIYDERSGPNRIRRADINTGANIVNVGAGGPYWHANLPNSWQSDLAFAHGYMYWLNVSNQTQGVLRETEPLPVLTTNTFVESYPGAAVPYRTWTIRTGPDGNVYWTYDDPGVLVGIKKFDGAAVTTFVPDGAGGLVDPRGIAWLLATAKLTAIPADDSTLDFGDIAQGGTGTLYSAVSLANTGDEGSIIDLQGTVLSGPGAAYFSIVLGNPNRDLDAGAAPEVFDLQFNAAGLAPSLYLADITFQNDSPQGDVTYHLSANVVAIAEPAGLGLIGMALLALRKRRA